MAPEVPVVFAHWERFTVWLFERSAGFPKRLRFSLTHRVESRTLDIHEALVEARYGVGRVAALERANLDLERLRLLLRLVRDLNAMPSKQAEHAFEQVDEAGRMVGGWLKHARGRG